MTTGSRNLRAEIDTIKQALKIEQGDQAAELERLIQVWRSASQTAAEEIFATVRDRVNKMGGVIAWRKKERDRKERMEEWSREGENEDEDDSDEDEDEEDEEGEGASKDPEVQARRQEAREAAREAKAAAREARELAKAEAAEQQEDKPASVDAADPFPDYEVRCLVFSLRLLLTLCRASRWT